MSGVLDQNGNNIFSVSATIKKSEPANGNQSSEVQPKAGQNSATYKVRQASSMAKTPARASQAPEKRSVEENTDTGFQFEFTSENMMNGIILSELLGKPKILQKRRW